MRTLRLASLLLLMLHACTPREPAQTYVCGVLESDKADVTLRWDGLLDSREKVLFELPYDQSLPIPPSVRRGDGSIGPLLAALTSTLGPRREERPLRVDVHNNVSYRRLGDVLSTARACGVRTCALRRYENPCSRVTVNLADPEERAMPALAVRIVEGALVMTVAGDELGPGCGAKGTGPAIPLSYTTMNDIHWKECARQLRETRPALLQERSVRLSVDPGVTASQLIEVVDAMSQQRSVLPLLDSVSLVVPRTPKHGAQPPGRDSGHIGSIKTSRSFAPFAGPTRPRFSIVSTMRAARL